MIKFRLPIAAALMLLASCASKNSPTATTKPTTSPAKSPSAVVNPLRAPRSLEALEAAPLYTFNEAEVDIYLNHLSAVEPDPTKRLVKLARKNIGQPYEIFLLGEGPVEIYDPDPLYCLDKSDCVTYVEAMYSMSLSRDWTSYFKTLMHIRYKDGKISMTSRNHETVADWDKNNAWLFDDVTKSLGDGKQWVDLNMTWQPAKFFAKFGIKTDMPDVKVVDAYIPRDKIEGIQKDLRPGDMIHIVRGDPKTEQWVGHVGFFVWGENNEPHFLHSAEPTVREQTLMSYVNRGTKTIGIKVLRPKPSPQQLVDEMVK